MKIRRFRGKHYFLSNFYPCEVEGYLGRHYPSLEHAYQAAKTLDGDEWDKIAKMGTAKEAKRYTRTPEFKAKFLRWDWEKAKLKAMEHLLENKFSKLPDLKERLLATGTAYLEEGNDWGDRYWGVCGGKGRNHLGLLLMKIRKKLREKKL